MSSIERPVEEANKEVFKEIYTILAEAVQKRINNEENMESIIKDFI